MQREDIEDERGAVDDFDVLADGFFKIGLLGGTQLVVEDDEIGGKGPGELSDFLGFARSDERPRIGRIELLGSDGDGIGASRVGKTFELGEGRLDRPFEFGEIDPDEDRALATFFRYRGGAALDDGFEFAHDSAPRNEGAASAR